MEYFNWTLHKKEKRAITFFCLLVILEIIIYHGLNYLPKPAFANAKELNQMSVVKMEQDFITPNQAKSENHQQVAKKILAQTNNPKVSKTPPSTRKKHKVIKPSDFDPNLVSKEELLQMNLPNYIADRIIKYRNKGGRFYEASDLKKIYGLSESTFETLKTHIQININPKEKYNNPIPIVSFLDINTASEDDFKKLNGIGPVLSKRICAYRDILGGFYDINQISETYGISDSLFLTIANQLFVDTPQDKIKINEIDVKTLKKHPYFSYKLAKQIINYRNQHGPYENLSDLRKLKTLDASKFEQIKPYLMI